MDPWSGDNGRSVPSGSAACMMLQVVGRTSCNAKIPKLIGAAEPLMEVPNLETRIGILARAMRSATIRLMASSDAICGGVGLWMTRTWSGVKRSHHKLVTNCHIVPMSVWNRLCSTKLRGPYGIPLWPTPCVETIIVESSELRDSWDASWKNMCAPRKDCPNSKPWDGAGSMTQTT